MALQIGGKKPQVMTKEQAEIAANATLSALADTKQKKVTGPEAIPFCQRYDKIKHDYSGPKARVRLLERLAREAVEAIHKVNSFGVSKDELLDTANEKFRVNVQALDVVDEQSKLVDLDSSIDGAKEFNVYRSYCRKSGKTLATMNDIDCQQLATLTVQDASALRFVEHTTQEHIQLSIHGISPLWLDTMPETLERLRSIDPAGYVVYMAAAWQHGELVASTSANVIERGEAYTALADDPHIMAKASIVETLAKVAYGTKQEIMLRDIVALPIDKLNAEAASFLSRLVKAATKTALKEKTRLSMAVFYRLSRPTPKVIQQVKKARGPMRTVASNDAIAVMAMTHAGDFDGLEFDMLGAVAHDTTLEPRDDMSDLQDLHDSLDDSGEVYGATDDDLWLEETLADVNAAIEDIGSSHMSKLAYKSNEETLEGVTLTGDPFSDLFD